MLIQTKDQGNTSNFRIKKTSVSNHRKIFLETHADKRCKFNLFFSFKEIVFRLDEILVDLHLKFGEGRQFIAEGRKFWKDNFLFPKQVKLNDFPYFSF
jgi:hypothetical protein